MLTKLRQNEPVRLYVYPGLVVVFGVLVGLGALNGDVAEYMKSGIALLLAIPAAEAARAKVTPTARATEAVVDVVHEIKDAAKRIDAASTLSPDGKGQAVVDEILGGIDKVADVADTYGRHARRG